MKDILRVASAVPKVRIGDVAYNEEQITAKIEEAKEKKAGIVVFPECALTGYSCGDLFLQDALLGSAESAIVRLASRVPENMLVAVGMPLLIDGQLYNVAVWLGGGEVICVVPKTFLPEYKEYGERRLFVPLTQLKTECVMIGGRAVPCGSILIETADGTVIGTEICEDLWAPIPPSSHLALAGATVICNLSACNETVGKRARVKGILARHSAQTISAYIYASAGFHESTADLLYSGYAAMAAGGKILLENDRLIDDDYILCADIDMGRIHADRRVNRTFGEAAAMETALVRRIRLTDLSVAFSDKPDRLKISKTPMIPTDAAKRENVCLDVFDMQAHALARRLEVTGGRAVIGVSGGLDSTLALLVAVESMKILGHPTENVYALTMPCFGTTGATYENAWALMRALGVSTEEIRIEESVMMHFRDIGQDPKKHDVTYENSQARERTQVLMDYANRVGGIVVGTGDLSELALGFCTYNADHMSMYSVNAGVPKTLIPHILAALSHEERYATLGDILRRVIETPVSPELLPPDEQGAIAQKTEEIVGPYQLHDFFIYYAVRFGYEPKKIEELARLAFDGEYDDTVIHRSLEIFYRRFFTQQFKRNCLPDGIKIGSIGFSPRGDFRMPSDASYALWLREIEQ